MVDTGATVMLKGVELIFRNFSGVPDETYNQQGHRTFAVLLPDDVAQPMAADGWLVKYLKPREDDEEQDDTTPQAFLPVRLNFEGRTPKVVCVTRNKMEPMDATTVGMLDAAEITNVDMIVRASRWSNPGTGREGIKAYAQTMYITIEEDPLTQEYNERFAQQEA